MKARPPPSAAVGAKLMRPENIRPRPTHVQGGKFDKTSLMVPEAPAVPPVLTAAEEQSLQAAWVTPAVTADTATRVQDTCAGPATQQIERAAPVDQHLPTVQTSEPEGAQLPHQADHQQGLGPGSSGQNTAEHLTLATSSGDTQQAASSSAAPRPAAAPDAHQRKVREHPAAHLQAGKAARKQRPAKQKDLPQEEADLLGWYAGAVRAAEQAHYSFPGRRTAASLGHALQQQLHTWLAPRLQDMGFTARPFPPLLPLDLMLELGGGSQPGDSADICTSHTFARWAAESPGDLPLLASQWHTVTSNWDLHNPGLLLHEGHAAHEWMGTAEEHAQAMIELYELLAGQAALPVVAGRSSRGSQLSGAASTFTLEALLGGGRAAQVAQAHNLADNFSRALGASVSSGSSPAGQGPAEDPQFLSHMGCGLRAALLGCLALVHGDAAGIALPPALAPVQVVVTPIRTRTSDQAAVVDEAYRIRALLARAGLRAAVDARRLKPAARFRASEQLGVPLRIEVGPADIKPRKCVIARRSAPGAASKLRGVSTEAQALAATVLDLLDDAQAAAQARAAEALQLGIVDVSSYYELREVVAGGLWARGPWAGSLQDEAEVLQGTGASLRCFPLQQPASVWAGHATCLYSGRQACQVAIFARPL